MNRAIVLLTAAAGVSNILVTRPASALGPVEVEVAFRFGGGTNPIGAVSSDDAAPPSILGIGIGGRAGVSVPSGLYGGISGMYYSGSSWLYGLDLGYSIKLSPFFTLRPVVGVGNYTVQGGPEVYTPYFEPGVMALLRFGLVFLGADADVFLTPGLANSTVAFMANAQVGVKF